MADTTPPSHGRRLDSWKAISAYLGRDESTVRRWERDAGLPVRRVPGNGRSSVFANVDELDAWLNMSGPETRGTPAEVPAAPPTSVSTADAPGSRGLWRLGIAFLVMALVAAAVVAWQLSLHRNAATAELTASAIIGRNARGAEIWRLPFPVDERWAALDGRITAIDVLGPPKADVIAGVAGWIRRSDEHIRGGELFRLSLSGVLQQTFSFNDTLRFAEQDYSAPWGLTDFKANTKGGSGWIAVAGHHYEWWPSVLTVLDDHWQRRGTFVNAGWIERLQWLSPDRVIVAGFNEAIDGGVVALLDPEHLNGQVPLPEALSKFRCSNCGTDRPVRYIVMPRTEVNIAGASRFNRAMLEVKDDRIFARTIEAEMKTGEGADVLYEFDRSLNLVNASFSERYWSVHHQLELEHKLDHSREQCPDRDGPRVIRVWNPATGWQDVSLREPR